MGREASLKRLGCGGAWAPEVGKRSGAHDHVDPRKHMLFMDAHNRGALTGTRGDFRADVSARAGGQALHTPMGSFADGVAVAAGRRARGCAANARVQPWIFSSGNWRKLPGSILSSWFLRGRTWGCRAALKSLGCGGA